MKNIYVILVVIGLVVMAGIAIPTVLAKAPNAGDGVSDGSGMDNPIQNGDPVVDSPGPAPNAGDGIPDGSGF